MISQDNELANEAEQAFLGILLIMPERLNEIIGILDENDFMHYVHKDIFAKIIELSQDGKKVSPIALAPYFSNNPDIPPMYLAELAGSVFSPVNLIPYAETIRQYADKRRLIEIVENFRMQSYETTDPLNLRSVMISTLETTLQKSAFARTKKEAAEDFVKSLSLPSQCYDVGIPKLTKTMGGGLYSGFTYGFAGGEKSGKTTTAQTISHNLNTNGVRHAYIALEMGSKQIEQRNIAREIGINSLRFLDADKGRYLQKSADYICRIPNQTIYLDMAGCSFQQIKSELMRLVAKEKITGFILDYWQLISGADHRQSKSDFLFEIAQWTAGYCRRNNIWSIVLSQLNREGKLLGSAGLERACDQLYVLGASKNSWREGIYMNLTHSRYTPAAQIGSESEPAFEIDFRVGPYLKELE